VYNRNKCMLEIVHNEFTSIGGKYDAMNDAMSIRIHCIWKAKLINSIASGPCTKLLNVVDGTSK
jgi:2-methoxy-6-polyprenyl-1,4-benzoquinol methylase